jgi:hypothetical protein
MKRILPVVFALLISLLLSGAVVAQESFAYFRLAHNAPRIGAVNLLINGNPTEIQNISYLGVTDWYRLRADNVFRFEVGAAGGEPISTVTKRLAPGSYTTLTLETGSTGRPTLSAPNAVARVRVAHLAQGIRGVDAFVNGERTSLTNLTLGNISGWVSLPVGITTFGVGPAGGAETTTITTNLRGDTWTTIAAVGNPAGTRAQLRVLSEDYGLLDPLKARVTVFHAVPNLGPVNIVINGQNFVQNLGFPGTLGSNDGLDTFVAAAGRYNLQVTSTANPQTVFFDVGETPLFGGRAYFVAAYGLPGSAQLLVTSTDVEAERGR